VGKSRTWSERARKNAKDHFFARVTLPEISRLTGIPHSTLKKWSAGESWEDQREENDQLERRARQAQLRFLTVVAESSDPDPQQMFAASTAAALTARDAPALAARTLLKGLLSVLGADELLGPPLRRRLKDRPELLTAMIEEAARLDAR
jgi:uncharacterized protein YjcR